MCSLVDRQKLNPNQHCLQTRHHISPHSSRVAEVITGNPESANLDVVPGIMAMGFYGHQSLVKNILR